MVESETKTETQYDLDMRIYKLLQDEPFFALLSRQLNKVPTDTIPTAGIRFNKEDARYELIYNPSFLAGENPQLPLNGPQDEKWVSNARTLSRKSRALYRANTSRVRQEISKLRYGSCNQ